MAKTIAQQLTIVWKATAPFQHALSTRAGCECVSHVLQGLTIDGVSAYDLISRGAMLEGGGQVFVRMFCGSPSEYEGGKKGTR